MSELKLVEDVLLEGEVARRIIKDFWILLSKASNPWINQISDVRNDRAIMYFRRWENTRVLLMRVLYRVVFHNDIPSSELFARTMDFLDGKVTALAEHDALSL